MGPPVKEVQHLTLPQATHKGTFTLKLDDFTTGPITFSSANKEETANQAEQALEDLFGENRFTVDHVNANKFKLTFKHFSNHHPLFQADTSTLLEADLSPVTESSVSAALVTAGTTGFPAGQKCIDSISNVVGATLQDAMSMHGNLMSSGAGGDTLREYFGSPCSRHI